MREQHEETGRAWDVTAAIYERDVEQDIALLRAGGTSLLAPERRALSDLGAWCGRAIHLQCAGGTDTLSLWKASAQEVVGVDISPRMISVARQKSEALAAPASWHCCDVLDAPHALDGTADLVYTGRGALPWMSDLSAWAEVVLRLLKPGGRLFVFEGHPFDWVWDTNADTFQMDPRSGGYFAEASRSGRWPIISDAIQQHPDRDQFRAHEHQWTLGDIVTQLVNAGLRVERLQEHPDLYWNQFPQIDDATASRLPHTFSLMMRK